MYITQDLAEDALIEARTAYEYPTGSGPIGVYQCDDCGHYHLTSKGDMNARLRRYIDEGKMKLQKEANRWLGKMKR